MVAQPAEIAARLAVIKALARLGQFEDDGRPMSEAEYRHSFKQLTYGCTDEDIAQFWYANLKYEGPAFFWYHELGSTPEGRVAAGKWSTLEPVIEERWNTPPIDLKAFRQRTRREWRDRKFVIEDMLDQLRDPGAIARPHFVWAAHHRVLGKRVNCSNEDRVWNTLKLLPRYVVNLLPKVDLYEDHFDGLMSDISGLSSSSLLHAYSTWSALESIRSQVALHEAHAQAQAHFQTPHVMPKREPSIQQPYAPTTEPPNTSNTIRDCHKPSTARQRHHIPVSAPSTVAPTPASPDTYERTTTTSQSEPAVNAPALDCISSNKRRRELGIEHGERRQDREQRTPKRTSPRCGEVDLSGVEETATRQWPMKLQVSVIKGDSRARQKVWATIDGGAMLCVLDSVLWAQFEHFVGKLRPSQVVCRMANGARVPSMGTAEVEIEFQGHKWPITFEVMDSRGAFELLIGKDWLNSTGARQDYLTDTISLRSADQTIHIANENPARENAALEPAIPVQPTPPEPVQPETEAETPKPKPTEKTEESIDEQQTEMREEAHENKYQDEEQSVPERRVSKRLLEKRLRAERRERNPFWVPEEGVMMLELITGMDMDEDEGRAEERTLEESWGEASREVEEERQREILLTERACKPKATNRLKEVLQRAKRAKTRVNGPVDIMPVEWDKQLTEPKPKLQLPVPESERTRDPFNPKRVAEILSKVNIGDDLQEEQKERVRAVLRQYADIFALSLSEVLPVTIAELKLDIPPDTVFPKKVGQKKLTEPQRQALYEMLDELERAGIIERVSQDQVAAVSPISMVPKPGGGSITSLKTLQQMANSECRDYDIPIKHPEAGFYERPERQEQDNQPAKWRLVQNFAAVNNHTKVRPFPMGDLLAKQQAIAGHRFVSVMDFHAGFHAIPVAPESVPYTGFHVDGRGYYVYRRMPFGLTSAPTTFCEMVAKALHDLIGDGLEIWMDDMAMAADDFESGLARLIRVFERCRTHKISLSAGKTILFMSEAKFAGAMVSKQGIRPDLSKVKSILEWPEPKSVLEVMSFVGVVNAYRSKIRNFARIAEPLTNLTRDVKKASSESSGRGKYKRALSDTKVELNANEKRAFVELKVALTSNPVLRAPVYDGRPFVVTTDGSKVGFGAVLSQVWEEEDSKGQMHKVTYPIAFASKRTSRAEERYPPFLLEFAALKFACDEFDSTIYGQPIEIETDCKALADLLGNNKLNSTHERWRESIIARNIVAVRHKPGVENTVCDKLSRMYEERADTDEGHGRGQDVDPGWETAHDLVNDLYLLTTDTSSQELLSRYGEDDHFRDIVLHLLYEQGNEPKDEDEARDWRRRAHRAEGYTINEGKLWLTGGKHLRGSTPAECIPSNEGLELAHAVHSAGGHFGRDLTILALQQEYHWPRMRTDVTEAIKTCPKCQNFGPRLLTALLQPITRARPLDLLVGDYVSFPEGHGGQKNVLIIMDVYSRFTFAFATRKPGTGKFTVDALNKIAEFIGTPNSFMADGGSHFDCEEVKQWARERGVRLIKTPPYAPWVNGLAEGGVKLLQGRLRTLCAPFIGTSRDGELDPEATPRSWPKFLSKAVAQLNDRMLPSLKYSPRELLAGMISAERSASVGRTIRDKSLPMSDVDINLALSYALRDDAFANALNYANRRKRVYDKKAKVIEYEIDDLVQKYDARYDETHNALKKLASRWSGAVRVAGKSRNSYRLVDLDGNLFAQAAHARLLRPFVPRAGTALAAYAEQLRAAKAKKSPVPEARDLPRTPRPEERMPLAREDPTQPNNYQDDDSDDESS